MAPSPFIRTVEDSPPPPPPTKNILQHETEHK